MVVWGGFKSAEERRKAKSKGGRGRYIQPNSELQRIERRDKKLFLSEQCKEIEENNKVGNTRDLFKRTEDSKEAFHTAIGTIKYRKSKDLKEAEEIKTRWQE